MDKKKHLCIKSIAKQVNSRMDSKDIIKRAHQFKAQYGNPSTGIPKAQDFDWYVLGRLDQLYDKQDENFKLIISKLENYSKEKVNNKTFWKVTSILTTLIVALIGVVAVYR